MPRSDASRWRRISVLAPCGAGPRNISVTGRSPAGHPGRSVPTAGAADPLARGRRSTASGASRPLRLRSQRPSPRPATAVDFRVAEAVVIFERHDWSCPRHARARQTETKAGHAARASATPSDRERSSRSLEFFRDCESRSRANRTQNAKCAHNYQPRLRASLRCSVTPLTLSTVTLRV